jgi:phosphatidylglycerol lysyltransferase
MGATRTAPALRSSLAERAWLTRPRHPPIVIAVAVATLASGLLNLYSLIQPPLSARLALLYQIFPLEFIQLSRFLTLVLGFALVISSFNVFRRKRRAFQAVVILAVLSVVFHLTKGVDYEEASLSFVLLVLLVEGRRHFTVRSREPEVALAAIRLGTALLVGIGYGVLGFWLLDPREFGIDFTLREAIHQTLQALTLSSDAQLVPLTRHAVWFLDSLSLMTVLMVVYALTLLFRPVLYRLRVVPQEHAAAVDIVREHGRSSLDFFKLWPDKSYFFGPHNRAFLAYSVGGGFALVLGDPVGPEDAIEPTVRGFAQMCTENGWGFAFYQTLPDFLPTYARCDLSRLKLGEDAIVDLHRFSLTGQERRSLRQAVHKIERQGIEVRHYDPPLSDQLLAELESVSNDWLQIPGRRERQFTLGRFDRDYIRNCPVLVAVEREGTVQAFVNSIRSYRKGESTIDLMRRRSTAPNGVMDFLLVKLLFHSRDQGFDRFSLGLAPMSGFQPKEDASPEERAIHFFFNRLTFIFSFGGLRAYKAKFATDWEPRYIVYRNVLDLPRVAVTLARVSEIR